MIIQSTYKNGNKNCFDFQLSDSEWSKWIPNQFLCEYEEINNIIYVQWFRIKINPFDKLEDGMSTLIHCDINTKKFLSSLNSPVLRLKKLNRIIDGI